MAVAEQTPYTEYTANGVTTSFALGFYCDSKDHLIVTVNDVEPLLTDWSLVDGAVVFSVAPINGAVVVIQRNTPFARPVDYQTYNNSFRAPAVNNDFDRIWLKLQELGTADWALRQYVDKKDNELRAFLLAEIQAQGVSLDQLDAYYNYLMQRLAEIAVNRGWEASFVVDASGKTQQEINNGLASILDMLAIANPLNGTRVFVKAFHAETNHGGGEFVYNSARSNVNDSCLCFYGWERVGVTDLDATLSGALADGTGRKLADLYTPEQYNLLYGSYANTSHTIDTIAIYVVFKTAYDNTARSSYLPFYGSSTAHIKPVGKYIINGPIPMYASNVHAYDSVITKATGYAGVMFYNTYPYLFSWDGGVFTSNDENTGAVWWLGPETDTAFNIDSGYLDFVNFEAVGFKDVFAKFNSQSAKGTVNNFRINKVQHVMGRGVTLDTTTGLYTEFLPKDFALQTNFRTPDWLEVSRGWLEAGDYFNTDLDALFYVGGDATFRDILGVPLPRAAGFDVAFCNALRNVYCDNVRAGGEGGSFALVNYFGKNDYPYPYYQSVVTVNNSELIGLNSVPGINYTLAETLVGDAKLTLKLNRTDGLPDKGIMKLGQFFVYDSIDRVTNTLNLVSPVIAYYDAGTEVANITARCIVRLIAGSPDQITFSDCYHGTEVGQLVGYSQLSDLTAVKTQFSNCHVDVQTSQIYPLYYSGLGLPPELFSIDGDKYSKQIVSGATRGKYVATADLTAATTANLIPNYTSLYDTMRYKVTVKNGVQDNDMSAYYIDLVKRLSRDVNNYLLIDYDVKLTVIGEGVAKITAAACNTFVSSYGNFQRGAPMWEPQKYNFGARLDFTFNQAVTGSIMIELV